MTKILLLPGAVVSAAVAGLGTAIYAIAAVVIVTVFCLLFALVRRDVVVRVEWGAGAKRVYFERLPPDPPADGTVPLNDREERPEQDSNRRAIP